MQQKVAASKTTLFPMPWLNKTLQQLMIFKFPTWPNKSVSPQAADLDNFWLTSHHFRRDAPPWGTWFRTLSMIYYDAKLEKKIYKKKKKSLSSGGIWTHDLMITRRVLYHCTTTTAPITANVNIHQHSPGLTMPFLMPAGSFLDHFATSSSILVILAGFIAQRQPFRWLPFVVGFSIFSKHLFRLRLCRTEFFQPEGAVRK